ncbi:uncharacterized protein K02A2.6-like [Saccostrea echinata]|uniref:uncharacterized protein K02A2.6-like n=1 Tax=Saccostrea echinata TaxID=191078 RepID=UPI002A8266A6|nr:uncharacterized protein K02A2.6-like [Saccostrea echinata]
MGEEGNAQQLIGLQVRSIGKIGSYDESIETWDVYTERVDLYFKANGVSEDLLVPSFLAVIGPKTYGLLKNIFALTKPADLTESVQKKVLAKPALTLDTAVKIAHAMETAGRDATELREQRNTSATVQKVNGSQKSKPRFFYETSDTETYASTTTTFTQTMLEMWSLILAAKILDRHQAVLGSENGKLEGIRATLYLEDNAQPKFCKARPVPYSLKPKVEEELKRLEKEGIIKSVIHSKWASPVVPVVKKNGQVRLCGDYKVTITPVMKVDQYRLPRIQDIFVSLAGGRKFSKIDLRQAYNQMEVDESSRELMTINTHKGLYQYTRLQFGVAAAPSIWQRAMDQVLQGIPFISCVLDDMIISGKTNEEHLANLDAVLEQLEKFDLRANLEKCDFFKAQVSYCGHMISEEGLKKSPDKVNAVLNAPGPENLQQLRSFLGLVNYYRSFLPNLSTVLLTSPVRIASQEEEEEEKRSKEKT